MSKLLDFYKGFIESLDCTIGKDGVINAPIYLSNPPPKMYVEVGDSIKRLVFPFNEVLMKMDCDKQVAFHPICENPHCGVSEVITAILRPMGFRLYVCIISILGALTILMRLPENKRLPLEARVLRDHLPEYADESKDYLWKVINNIGGYMITSSKPLFLLQLERDCDYRYASFQLKIKKTMGGDICGVEGEDEKKAGFITSLFDTIFPVSEMICSSNDIDTPYLTALLRLYLKVSYQLNDLHDILISVNDPRINKRLSKEHFGHRIDTSWESVMKRPLYSMSKELNMVLECNSGTPSTLSQ